MSECPHLRSAPPEHQYHIPLGPNGIECCLNCYVSMSPPHDISVFTTLNRAFGEQWTHDYEQAKWLLAEKDAEIAELRDTIEVLEAGELS